MVTRKKEDGHSLVTYRALKENYYDIKSFQTERAFNVTKNMILKKPLRFIGHKKDKKMRTFTRRALQCGVKYVKKDIK